MSGCVDERMGLEGFGRVQKGSEGVLWIEMHQTMKIERLVGNLAFPAFWHSGILAFWHSGILAFSFSFLLHLFSF